MEAIDIQNEEDVSNVDSSTNEISGEQVEEVDTIVQDEGKDELPVPEISSHELLSEGFMKQVLPIVESVQDKVNEVNKNQTVLIESLQRENEKMSETNFAREIESSIADVKHYRAKVLNIRKDMMQLSEKTTRLKQRSEKIQKLKQREEIKEEEKRQKILEQERSLIAKPANDT